jgi:exosortase/archaeosortase family protein
MAVPPEPTGPTGPVRRSAAERLVTPVRLVLALAIWGAMGTGIAYAAAGRTVEARIAAVLAGPVMPGHSRSIGDVVLTGLGTRESIGLQITNECTVLLLIIPMLFIAGLIILFRRFRVHRVLFGLLMGLLVVVLTNQVRVLLIAWATQHYGFHPGYEVSHKLVGSVLAIFGFALGVLVMFRLAPGRRSDR